MLSLSLSGAQFRSVPTEPEDDPGRNEPDQRSLLRGPPPLGQSVTMSTTTRAEYIPYFSCHDDANETIILVHGAFSSPDLDWSGVIPLLPQYHLLVPCLSHLPLTLETLAERIATLVRAKAKGGRAHIYGFSMGAQVALQLCDSYPEVCSSLIISGYRRFKAENTGLQATLPYFMGAMANLSAGLPRGMVKWAMHPKGQLQPTSAEKLRLADPSLAAERPSLSRAKQMASMLSAPASLLRPTAARVDRVLIVAADKGSVFWPSNDPLDEVQALASAMRAAKVANRASVNVTTIKGAQLRHPWHIGDPKLCAHLIEAFLSDDSLPEAFDVIPPIIKPGRS